MTGVTSQFRALLGRLQAFRVVDFTKYDGEDGRVPAELGEANVVSSQVKGTPLHIVAIDLDFPAHLIPSSTPGHSHLYVEIPPVSLDAYLNFLQAAALIGLVEDGYVAMSAMRGHTDLRLPWVTKSDDPTPPGAPLPIVDLSVDFDF